MHPQKGTEKRELRVPEWKEGSGQTTEGLCSHPAMSRLHSFGSWEPLKVLDMAR